MALIRFSKGALLHVTLRSVSKCIILPAKADQIRLWVKIYFFWYHCFDPALQKYKIHDIFWLENELKDIRNRWMFEHLLCFQTVKFWQTRFVLESSALQRKLFCEIKISCSSRPERAWPLVINWGQLEDPLPGFMFVIKHNLFDFLLQVSYFFLLLWTVINENSQSIGNRKSGPKDSRKVMNLFGLLKFFNIHALST